MYKSIPLLVKAQSYINDTHCLGGGYYCALGYENITVTLLNNFEF